MPAIPTEVTRSANFLRLAAGEGQDKFQGGVGGGETDNLYVFQAGLADGGDYFVFGDFGFSFGVDDPEGGGAFDGSGCFGDLGG
jgi:hypothetical protein